MRDKESRRCAIPPEKRKSVPVMVHVEPPVAERLQAISRERGCSLAETVRRAIAKEVTEVRK
jgi:predicted HicB family RNase H-like nuclease